MNRQEILNELWNQQDIAFDITTEYDALPHRYGHIVLYQAEAYMIDAIGENPGITTTELAEAMGKSVSACSQIIKKLSTKKLVIQTKNEFNGRLHNLELTAEGYIIYSAHIAVIEKCKQATYKLLESYSNEELMAAIDIQRVLNYSYANDVKLAKADMNAIRSFVENS